MHGEREVTLSDGRVVSNYSREFIAWCEARTVCRMPTKRDRRMYLARVEAKRGFDASLALEALVKTVWQLEFGGSRGEARRAQQDGPPADWVDDCRDATAEGLQGGFAGF